MKIIFGQGNPGSHYTKTRHNTGFLLLDSLAQRYDAPWHHRSAFTADIAEVVRENEKILLVKPTSFYNETGLVARKLIDFYKCDPSHDLLVIHDDLALPFGTIRVRTKGSDAGNNGIKSLNNHLGQQFMRIRVGIWNEQRNLMDDADFVLAAFTNDELQTLEVLGQTTIPELFDQFIAGTLKPSQYK